MLADAFNAFNSVGRWSDCWAAVWLALSQQP